MALIDDERGQIVVRIVYDGPALSGKTTSLRTLAGSLGRDLFTGGEADGRTLFFDWLDYTGGRFEGYPIRCQIVSVPGQHALRSRRAVILSTADAVVFVADTRESKILASAQMAESMRVALERGSGRAPGVVIQANKRDAEDAVSMDHVRLAFGLDGKRAFMESVATSGIGVRETFIFAVRLALDRVRDQMEANALPRAKPAVDSGSEFMEALRSAEMAQPPADLAERSEAIEAFGEALLAETEAIEPRWPAPASPNGPSGESPPALPAFSIPSGLIWPPVGGRMFLHEALSAANSPPIFADGDWTTVSGPWRLHSYAGDCFESVEASRRALLEWARLHASAGVRLSPRRCIVAADDGRGAWRLWQAVQGETTIRAALWEVLTRVDAEGVARGLLEIARTFAEGGGECRAYGVNVSIDSLGLVDSAPMFVGLAPPRPSLSLAQIPAPLSLEELLQSEFAPVIGEAVRRRSVDVPRVLHHLPALSRSLGQQEAGQVLAVILIGA